MKQKEPTPLAHKASRWLSLGLALALCACLTQPLLAADAPPPNANSLVEAESTPSSVPPASLPSSTSTPSSVPPASLPSSTSTPSSVPPASLPSSASTPSSVPVAEATLPCEVTAGCPLPGGHTGECEGTIAPFAAPPEVTTGYFYKTFLTNENQKTLYRAIVAAAAPGGGLMSGTAKVGATFPVPAGTDAQSWARAQNFGLVTFAVVRDHPEIFWLDYDQLTGYDCDDTTPGQATIYITLTGGATTYLMEGFADEADVLQNQTALNAKVDEILAASPAGSRLDTLHYFNKWLVNNNRYNTAAAKNSAYRKAWSAVSGLLSNNVEATGPICFGYAVAFKVLCDRAGIPCLVVEGNGLVVPGTAEGHAWNYVQMEDDNWYAIDPTWNDQHGKDTTYFLVGGNTITDSSPANASIATFAQNHIPSSNNGYPTLSATSYIGDAVAMDSITKKTYTTLQDALDDATSPIVLLQDVALEATVTVRGEKSIQFKGFTIRNKPGNAVSPLIQVDAGGHLTLQNQLSRLGDPAYKGDIYHDGSGVAVHNLGTLLLRDADLSTASGTAITGSPYTLGKNSVSTYEDDSSVVVHEASSPLTTPVTLSFSPADLGPNPTLDTLTAAVKAATISLSHTWIFGGPIAESKQQAPTWRPLANTLSYGYEHTYTATVYGYTITANALYRYPTSHPLSGTLAIGGTPQTGQTLEATPAISLPGLGKLRYQWLRDGTPIAGQTSNRYVVQAADAGKTIVATVSSPNFMGSLTSNGLVGVAAPSSTLPQPQPPAPQPPTPQPPAPQPQPQAPQPPTPQPTAGQWKDYGGRWCYLYPNGSWAYGWAQINGTWYAFDGEGYMHTGWLQNGGSWYFMQGSGAMHTGWLQNGGSWYFMQGSGAMHTGWLQNGGSWYYLNGSGAMKTGWLSDGSNWYYLSGGGQMQTGWLYTGGAWYYLNGSGQMQTGWLYTGGAWYYLNASGNMVTGRAMADGAWHGFAANGVWQGPA